MINLKKILVPVDFSESSRLALKYAASLAAEYGSQIHCLHVIEEESFHPGNLSDPLETSAKWEKRSTELLNEFVKNGFGDFDVIRRVQGGMVFETILKYCTDQEINLIILGAHGQGSVVDSWLGGNSYQITRKAPCPVLTVKTREQGFLNP